MVYQPDIPEQTALPLDATQRPWPLSTRMVPLGRLGSTSVPSTSASACRSSWIWDLLGPFLAGEAEPSASMVATVKAKEANLILAVE